MDCKDPISVLFELSQQENHIGLIQINMQVHFVELQNMQYRFYLL